MYLLYSQNIRTMMMMMMAMMMHRCFVLNGTINLSFCVNVNVVCVSKCNKYTIQIEFFK